MVGLFAVAAALGAHAQDYYDSGVVADVGDYSYNGYQYDSLSIGDAIEGGFDTVNGAVGTIGEATAFINRSTSFAAWRSFNDGNAFVGTRGGLNLYSQQPFLYRGYSRPEAARGFRLGPLYFNDLFVGAGVLYSEYSGTPVRPSRFRGNDDPWSAILWASATVSAYVYDTFAFSFRPYVYYLPLEGKVGFSGVSTIFGFNGGMVPRSMLDMAYRIPLGNWDLTFYDRFDAVFAQTSILDESLFFHAAVQDMSAYDAAGRYGFGGFGVPLADATGRGSLDFSDRFFDDDRMVFRNFAGANINGKLGGNLFAHFFYERYDQWNNDFDHRAGLNSAGFMLVEDHPYLSKYVGYRISGRDNSDTIQWAFAGVKAVLGPRLNADARIGYMWRDGGTVGQDSWIGQLLLEHQLGPYTWHGLNFGRTVTDPAFGSRYLADYVRYYLAHNLSERVQLRIFAQVTDAERLDSRTLSNYSSFVVGALMSMELSPSDSITLLNGYERFDLDSVGRTWDLWTHRLAYIRRISDDCSAQFYYQFQHGDSNTVLGSDFAEHLVYLGVVKRF